jgi:hypothetical protein
MGIRVANPHDHGSPKKRGTSGQPLKLTSLGGPALVMMVQAAEVRDLDDRARGRQLHLT